MTDSSMFVIEGTISDFHCSYTKENLFKELSKNNQATNAATGIMGVLGDMHGVAASSAMLAMYDGEDVYSFACLVDQQPVFGTLPNADGFRNGDHVKVAVTQQGDVLKAHAVLWPNEEVVWMPTSTHMGPKALFRQQMRWATNMLIGAFICLLIFSCFVGFKFSFIFLVTLIAVILFYPMAYSVYRTMSPTGHAAAEVFKVFGFPDPEDFDLLPGLCIQDFRTKKRTDASFSYRKAIEHHMKRIGQSTVNTTSKT